MKILKLIRFLCFMIVAGCGCTGFSIASISTNRTHCKAQEKIIFNCSFVNKKTISMCGSPDLAKESGTLQYRYGFIGKRLELEYPNSNDNVDKKFSITSSGSGKWHDRKINFEINNFTYSLSSYENMNIPEEDFSISIFKNRKIFRYLICIKNSIHDDTWILEDILK